MNDGGDFEGTLDFSSLPTFSPFEEQFSKLFIL